jgi:hypothetical protein
LLVDDLIDLSAIKCTETVSAFFKNNAASFWIDTDVLYRALHSSNVSPILPRAFLGNANSAMNSRPKKKMCRLHVLTCSIPARENRINSGGWKRENMSSPLCQKINGRKRHLLSLAWQMLSQVWSVCLPRFHARRLRFAAYRLPNLCSFLARFRNQLLSGCKLESKRRKSSSSGFRNGTGLPILLQM